MNYHIMDPTYKEQKDNWIGTYCVGTTFWNMLLRERYKDG